MDLLGHPLEDAWRWLCDRVFRLVCGEGNGEEDHLADLERLDREQPGWDDESRSVSAEIALGWGWEAEKVRACFGERPTQLALERVKARPA